VQDKEGKRQRHRETTNERQGNIKLVKNRQILESKKVQNREREGGGKKIQNLLDN
jgi:hypothetical protein